MGHTVTSRWLNGTHEAQDGDVSRWKDFASEDLDDIKKSQVLIAFTESEMFPRVSRHVELGIALGRGIYVAIVGPLENVFCCLPGLMHYESFDGLEVAWREGESR